MSAARTVNQSGKKTPFPVIGIGAAAGGLIPFEKVLETLPTDFDAAVVFIQYFLADRKSLLSEVLRNKFPSRDIVRITNGMTIEKGKVYVNQPDHDITMESGHFRARRRRKTGVHLPIDTFFTSLAEAALENAIVVILSGAGADGSRGVREVQCKGGAVLVQDPDTAEFAGMPGSAIEAGAIDEVLTPENIARRLVALVETISKRPGAAYLEKQPALTSLSDFLREKADFRFDHYKKTVIARRVQRRMSLKGLVRIENYMEYMEKEPAEIDRLAADLMIGVTAFFRDPVAWEALKREVIPALIGNKRSAESIRVWAPGCSTGEEAYSIVMTLLHEIEAAHASNDVQVFATDINDTALTVARYGKYPGSVSADIPPEYQKAYFSYTENGSHVCINQNVRDHVIFAKQSLLTDPPFSKLDLIICRNLLIYLEPEAQEKCIAIFHYALKEDGYLFLGNAESIEHRQGIFKPVGVRRCRIFQRIAQANPPRARYQFTAPAALEPKKKEGANRAAPGSDGAIARFAHETLLSLYAPAAVLVNNRYEILHFNGPVKRFIEPPADLSFFDFIAWIPEQMRNRVRGALYNASQTPEPVSVQIILPNAEHGERTGIFTIRHCKNPADDVELYLITFVDNADNTAPQRMEGTVLPDAEADRAAFRQLERELSTMRTELQTKMEELKNSNEELEAANEEMETSHEELQSINEELITGNAQLQSKIEEQEATNNDLNNFLSSTNIPTLFLDHQLKVRRYTPSLSGLINLIPSDIGRPVADMALERLGVGLVADIRGVLDSLETVKREVAIGDAWYLRSTFPFRTPDNRVEGVVVTFVDISELLAAETDLKKEKEKFKAIFENSNDGITLVDLATGRYIDCNKKLQAMIGYSLEEICAMKIGDFWSTPHKGKIVSRMEKVMADGVSRGEMDIVARDGTLIPVDYSAFTVTIGASQCMVNVMRDITTRKMAQEEIQSLSKFPSENPNPIVRLSRDGVVLYANEAGEPLLKMWNAAKGSFVPEEVRAMIGETVAAGSSKNVDIECDGRIFSVHVVPVPELGYVNLYGRDITKRKKAEEALRESEERFRTIAEALPVLICISGAADSIILYVNTFFCRTYGYRRENIIGGKAEDIYADPADREKMMKVFTAHGYIDAYQVKTKKSDGTPLWLLNSLRPLVFEGKPALISASIDITWRRQAEEALRESQTMLKAALASMTDAVFISDTEGRFVNFNDAFATFYKFRNKDEYVKTFAEFPKILDVSFPDGTPVPVDKWIVPRALRGETDTNTEYRLRRKDTGETWVGSYSFAPLRDMSGTITGSVVVARDITERQLAQEALRESEERYRTLVKYAPAGIYTIDFTTGRYTEVNDVMCRILGYTREELLAIPAMDLLDDKGKADFASRIRRGQSGDPPEEVIEYRVRTKDGRFIWAFLNVTFRWSDGKIVGATVVGHDITERKQAEEALNEAYAALHARNAELDSFNYSVSHDLRGPLRTIGAFSRMLGDEYGAKLDDEGKGYLDQVLKSTDRMATIIDDLLKLSRLTKAEIKRTEVDLSSIAKALAQDLLKGNQKGNFQREVEFVIDDNIVIYADSGLMRIVMDNLFSNAWKFTSKRSQAKIEFSSKRKGGKTICFVRDNGDGFNMAHSKKLFTPFQRLHSESEFPGIGIGLAITRRIIERHGGKVWAESEPGSGATIYFEVPAGIDIRQIPPGGIGGNEP